MSDSTAKDTPPKLIFMGTPQFAVPSLVKLAKHYEISAIFTRPDREGGRGHGLIPPPIKLKGIELGIPVFQYDKIKSDEGYEKIASLNPEMIVVAAFGQILPKRILELPRLGCINVHASLLPKLRGAAPINWAIIRGENKTGITTMKMDVGLDTGDMLLRSETEILPTDDAITLTERLSNMGAELISETVEKIFKNEIIPEKQDDALATFAPIIKKDTGRINWNDGAAEVFNLVRGLLPWPVASFDFKNLNIKVFKTRIVDGHLKGEAGIVKDISENGIEVYCGHGVVSLLELQIPGKRRMAVKDMINGFPIRKGERFT